jgi:hypothetical protein
MNVKGIEPFHRLPDVTVGFVIRKVPIGDFPSRGRNDEADPQPIEGDGIHHERESAREGYPKADGIGDAGYGEEDELQRNECRVVPRPVVLGLLAVVRCLVHDLRPRGEERPHLIEGALDVHLPKIRQPGKVLGVARRGSRRRRSGGGGGGDRLPGGGQWVRGARWYCQSMTGRVDGHDVWCHGDRRVAVAALLGSDRCADCS